MTDRGFCPTWRYTGPRQASARAAARSGSSRKRQPGFSGAVDQGRTDASAKKRPNRRWDLRRGVYARLRPVLCLVVAGRIWQCVQLEEGINDEGEDSERQDTL